MKTRTRKNLEEIGIELLPIAIAASLSGVGRATEMQELPAVPIAMDFMLNAQGYFTPKGLWGLVKYSIGIALPYTDKIYVGLENYLQ